MAGSPILNELTWSDVKIVLRGLRTWYEECGRWVGVNFWIREEKGGRIGELGDGFLEVNKKEVEDQDEDVE